ncbi:hypothetical protein [Mycolicibacterium wolinskyi]|uniref:hypothetical protein n=1 Tax=Mycolicibacterium wolinskyi TaxID=59750 RepID=UPI0039179802
MATYDAGDASINVRPSLKDFKRLLAADLQAIDAPTFDVPIAADITRAQAEMERWRAQQEQDALDIRVDVDTSSIARVVRELDSLSSAGAKAMSALKWNAGALGLGSLPAMATGVASVAAALQQVAQVGLVLPGMFAGIATSVGTVALGFKGMGDAVEANVEALREGTPEAVEKANDSLKRLAPSAQEVVKALAESSDVLDHLNRVAAQPMFEGVDQVIRDLTGKSLPTLEKGLGSVGKAWNATFKELGATLGSDQSLSLLDRIFGNTADAQTRANAAIEPLVNAFGTLTAAGSDTLPRLADGLTGIAERFNRFITAADQDGRLAKWIDEGIKGIGHLGSIVLDLGKSFTAITEAAGGGEGLLALLDTGAEKLATFLNSAEGQDKLTQFFNEGKEQLGQWLPILQNLVGIFGGVYSAAKQWTDAMLPPLQQITGFLAEHPGLIQGVATAFIAWKTIDGVTSLLGALTNVSTMLRVTLPAAAAEGAAAAGASLGPLAAIIGGSTAGIYALFSGGRALLDNQALNGAVPSQARPFLSNEEWLTLSPEEILKRLNERGGTFLAPTPAPPDSSGLASVLGAPEAPPPPNPRAVQGPLPASPGGLFGPGGALGAAPPSNTEAPEDLAGLYGAYERGGPTPSGTGPGPTGGFLAELHGDEWVANKRGRAVLGDEFLAAANLGLVDLGRLPGFEGGGYIDPNGNPVHPGVAPGPGAAPSIAPNPYQGGGLAGIFNSVASGIQGPIGNAMALGSSLANLGTPAGDSSAIPGLQSQHGAGTIVPAGYTPAAAAPLSLADRAARIPGLWGLVGSAFSSDPASNLMAWGEQTGQWLGNFTARTVGSFTTALWQGALDMVGLGGSILSPNNTWNQAGQSVGEFAFGSEGPLGQLLGANQGAGSQTSAAAGSAEDPRRSREAVQKITRADQRVAEIQKRISELPANAKESRRAALHNDLANAQQDATDAREDLARLGGVNVGSGGGRARQSISSTYPTEGSGAERWRPTVRQVLATYGPAYGITTANAQSWEDALVRQIATESGGNPNSVNPNDSNGRGGRQRVAGILNFLEATFNSHNITGGSYMDPAAQIAAALPYVSQKWGVDDSGAPLQIGRGQGFSGGGAARGPGGPKGDKIAAWLSDNEHVLTSEDVDAMGGQDEVYAFRSALHRAWGGEISTAAVRPAPAPRPPLTEIKRMMPPPPAAAAPAPRPTPPPAPAAAAPPPAPVIDAGPPQPAAAAPQPPNPTIPPAGAAAHRNTGAGGVNHNLPAIDTAIDSTASTLGNIAATAISMGAAGAGGAGGVGAGAAGALASSMAQGLFQQGGKIAKNVVNVFSSALVGNLGDNTTAGAYGAPVLSAPPQPARSIDASTRFGDVHVGDPRDFVEQQRLYEQQREQSMVSYV